MKAYELVKKHYNEGDLLAYTCVFGEFAGDKALVSKGKVELSEGIFLNYQEELLKHAPKSSQGLCYFGEQQVYFERLCPQAELVVVGGGHVGIPLIKMGKLLGFRVSVVEDRAEYAELCELAGADKVIHAEFQTALESLNTRGDAYYVIVTRAHQFDAASVHTILSKPHAYIGVMGSANRTAVLRNGLKSMGHTKKEIDSIHSPIGLNIFSETPEEISVSIFAQIISIKNKKNRAEPLSLDMLDAILSGGVLCTIVDKSGSAARNIGTKMFVSREGHIIGTVGGGRSEADIIAMAKTLIENPNSKSDEYRLDMRHKSIDELKAHGVVCGGYLRVFLERI